MQQRNKINMRRLLIFIQFLLGISVNSLAQLNTDGTYTLKLQDGSSAIYYPYMPKANGKEIDTLSVQLNDTVFSMFFRVSDRVLQKQQQTNVFESTDMPKMTNENGTVTTYFEAYPTCDCEVDTLINEMPDGSFKYYYTIRNENKNLLKKVELMTTSNKMETIDVYENTDEMPIFRRGKSELVQFIKKNIKFNNHGKRYVGSFNINFIVLSNGKITQIQFDNEYTLPPPALEKELIRIFKNMPLWKPGMVAGKKVNVFYTLQLNLVI